MLAKRPTSPLNRLVAAIILGLGVWSLAEIFLLNPEVPKTIATIFVNIGAFGWCSFASLFLWFALIFTNKSYPAQIVHPLLIFVPALFIHKQWTGGLVIDLIRQPYGWAGVWSPSIWTDLFDVYYLSFSGLGLYLIFCYGRNAGSVIQKKQSTIIVTIGIISLIFGSLLDRVFPRLDIYAVPQSAIIAGLIWASGMVYAIARYRFLTITPATAAENIIATMADFLILLEPQGKIVTVNQSTLDALGYEKEELEGNTIDILFDGGSIRNNQKDAILHKETVENYSLMFMRKTGEKLPVLLSSSALIDEASRTAGIVVVARDISERKQAEEALRKAHDELERRVQERTAELKKANEALQAEITERVRAEGQIRASLQEKEVLLKEIHHRVKNNLQVISSLLYLQSKNINDGETLDMFQDSRNRVRSMALVHERLYQSQDLARVDFAEYVQSFAIYLFQSYAVNSNVIKLEINVDDVFLGVDTAIPCGLILNELVSNSLKHAFPEGREGEIRVRLHSDDEGQSTLIVSDNGVGFPKDLDFRGTESLGLQLVNTLVAQLEGTIELDRSGGTAFKITFTQSR